jgi:hypothetical protein
MGSFNYEDKLFYICIAIIVITFLIGLSKVKPYTKDNEQEQASTQKVLCLIYGVFFILGAYGATLIFSGTWWSWVIIIGFGMMGFGALQEAFKKFPNAPKGYGEKN